MAYCIKCGQKLSEEANFCPNCGCRVGETTDNSLNNVETRFGTLSLTRSNSDILSLREAIIRLDGEVVARQMPNGSNAFDLEYGQHTLCIEVLDKKIFYNFTIDDIAKNVIKIYKPTNASGDISFINEQNSSDIHLNNVNSNSSNSVGIQQVSYVGPPPKKKHYLLKILGLLLLVIGLCTGYGALFGSDHDTMTTDDAPEMTKEEYKDACEKLDYEDVSRNPDNYLNAKVKFTGQIFQVVNQDNNTKSTYLIAVTKDEYGFYDDNVYVSFDLGDDSLFMEEDIVKVYGKITGEQEYRSLLGQSITVPKVYAKYMYLKE